MDTFWTYHNIDKSLEESDFFILPCPCECHCFFMFSKELFTLQKKKKIRSLFTLWISNKVEENNPSRYQAKSITWYLQYIHQQGTNLHNVDLAISVTTAWENICMHSALLQQLHKEHFLFSPSIQYNCPFLHISVLYRMMESNLSLLVFQALLEAVYVNSAQCLSYSAILTMSATLLQEMIILIGCPPQSPCQWAWLL